MQIAVVGLGGVGGYISASLAKSGSNVVGFARGEHLLEIQKRGITIVEDETSWTQPLNAQQLDNAEGYFDIVLFCVKSYDLEKSYKKIAPSIDKNSILVSFSNGVSNGELLRDLSSSIVLDACVYILSHIEKSGVIRKQGKVFAIVFGGDSKATQKLHSIFDNASLRNKTPEDIQTALWKKYIFISAFATLTSYYNETIGYIYEYHKEEAQALLEEIALVAKSLGIEIFDEVEKAMLTASKVPYKSSTSMYLDFKNHKKSELETLSGYIVDIGKNYNVSTPIMSKMCTKLRTL